jgi:hypothetical protein
MYYQTGWKLWPGGSLVSGNIADGGANATGCVTEYAPSCPSTGTALLADSTHIDLTSYEMVRVCAVLTGTVASFDVLTVGFLIASFDPMSPDENPNYFIPRITACAAATGADDTLPGISATGSIPAGSLISGASAISSYYQPFIYPANNIGLKSDLSNGFNRDAVQTYGSTLLTYGLWQLPLTTATKMTYRVLDCNITGSGAAITGVGLRLLYNAIRKA